jgi:hypothetical protein
LFGTRLLEKVRKVMSGTVSRVAGAELSAMPRFAGALGVEDSARATSGSLLTTIGVSPVW